MPRRIAMPADALRLYLFKNAGKKTPAQMKTETNVPVATISKYLWNMGFSTVLDEKVTKRELLIETIKEKCGTHTAAQVAALLKVPRSTVYYRAWLMGITMKSEDDDLSTVHVSTNEKFFNPHKHTNWLVG